MLNCCNVKEGNRNVERDTNIGKVDAIINKYKRIPGSLITVLQETQEIYSYLSKEALDYVAKNMEIKAAKVYGVATFYTQFRLKPIGKYEIMLCQGTACHVNGAKAIEEAILEELGIKNGETTKDNLFTLNNVACLGCCSLSPVMMINGETYGKLTPDMAKKIIKDVKAQDEKGLEV